MALCSRPQAVWRTVRTCHRLWDSAPAVQGQVENSSSKKFLLGLGFGGRRWARGMATTTLRVFIVTGEPPHGISLLPVLSSSGVRWRWRGLYSQFPLEDISVMGAVELIPHAFRLWARLRETVAAALKFQPNVVITVDAKGFSFRVLNGLRGGEERLKNLATIVDLMLCILPFEEAVCQANGLTATFVGHPVLEDAHSALANGELHGDHNWQIGGDGAHFRESHGIDPGATVLSLLPGSRLQEVQRMLPIFEGALRLLAEYVPNLTVVIPTIQSQLLVHSIEALVRRWNVPVVILPGASDTDKYNAFAASNAGLCTSGTAVVQLLMGRVPCVVAYRAHLLTEWIIRRRTKLQFISLPNILLDSAVVPETLFGACTPKNLVSQLRSLLKEESRQKDQMISAVEVLRMLAPPSREYTHTSSSFTGPYMSGQPVLRPSAAAALAILRLLDERASQY